MIEEKPQMSYKPKSKTKIYPIFERTSRKIESSVKYIKNIFNNYY